MTSYTNFDNIIRAALLAIGRRQDAPLGSKLRSALNRLSFALDQWARVVPRKKQARVLKPTRIA